MNKQRCVNCGVCLDEGDGVECNALKHIALDLLPKLECWLNNPLNIHPSSRICEPCLMILKSSHTQRLVNQQICLGCGDRLGKFESDSFEVADADLDLCKSWVSKEIYVDHLTKVCQECYNRLKTFSIKTETEFVGVEDNIEPDDRGLLNTIIDIKSEPDCLETYNESCIMKNIYTGEIENLSNQNSLDDINDQNNLEDINDQNSLEDINDENSLEDINEQNSLEDINDQNSLEDLSDQNSLEDLSDQNSLELLEDINEQNNLEDISEQNNLENHEISDLNYSEEECTQISATDDADECIEYEYLEESPPYVEHSPKPKNVKRKWNSNRKNDDYDEDYVPSVKIMKSSIRGSNLNDKRKEENGSIELTDNKATLKLSKYSRTFRIGCCIFNNCKQDCISLVPRTVRRRMIIEYNVYIPPLSRVCKEHLQDQNWEELVSNTTKKFTAQQCQDMKDIVKEACCTNFDFENIETVEARLVRYWFDVNKTEFKRIFGSFPKLKRFKKCKTVFALYLMHLQKTSLKRIALLLKMNEKMVKRMIRIGGDIVQCDSYSKLKEQFLEDD